MKTSKKTCASLLWLLDYWNSGTQGTGITPGVWEERKGKKEKAESWCQSEEELITPQEISHSSDNLSDYIAEETGVETMTCQWWLGPHLDQDCIAMPSNCSSIET